MACHPNVVTSPNQNPIKAHEHASARRKNGLTFVGGNVEVQNAAAVMGQNQENVENLEADRGHREEINRDQLLGMILKECPPALRGRFVSADHVFADAAFSDVDAEFE